MFGASVPALEAAQHAYDREIEALSKFRHPHIVRLLAYSAPEGSFDRVLVYEYLSAGSLGDNLRDDERAAALTWKARVLILQQVATALSFMHKGGPGVICFLLRWPAVPNKSVCYTKDKFFFGS